MEPLPEDAPEKFVFEKEIVGNAIPPSFIPACEKGFREACNSGGLTGHPVQVATPHPSSLSLPTTYDSTRIQLLHILDVPCSAPQLRSPCVLRLAASCTGLQRWVL